MKNFQKNSIIFIILLFIIICIAIYFFTKDSNEPIISTNDFYLETTSNVVIDEETTIIVHIDGEVLYPGIVTINKDARISDAIEAAGGTTPTADISKVNLAYILNDGQKIYIPSIYDEENTNYITDEAGENILVPDANTNTKLININSATVNELTELPGIGESTATKIIKYREENGKFKTLEDIMNVSGIGEAKFNTIKEYISI